MPDHSTAAPSSSQRATQPAAKPPLRQRDIWPFVLPGLWLPYIASKLWGMLYDGISVAQSEFAADNFGYQDPFSLAGHVAAVHTLNLWGLVAGPFLGLVVLPNRCGWSNGKRFALGGIALAMMVGRVVPGIATALVAAYVPVQLWLAAWPLVGMAKSW